MIHKIPEPITRRIWTFVGCISVLSVFGVVWTIATKDRTILMLSLALLAAGILKAVSLYSVAAAGHFVVYEGTISLYRAIPLRKRHELCLTTSEGETVHLLLDGRSNLRQGSEYRLYVRKNVHEQYSQSLPNSMKPSCILLGYERISTQSLA